MEEDADIELFFAGRLSTILGHESVESYIFNAKPLEGLKIASSDSDIQAVQLTANFSLSAWVGEPDKAADSIGKLALDKMISWARYFMCVWSIFILTSFYPLRFRLNAINRVQCYGP